MSANNVTINGAGYTVTASGGNASYAVSSGSYTNVNLQDIIFTGFGSGVINSSSNVTYLGTNLNLTNSTTTASSLILSYTNSLTVAATYFSNLSSLIINSIDLGSITAGIFSWNQQNISSCQTISTPGNYKLTQDISGVTGTCFVIASNKVIIDGGGHTVTATGGNTSYAFTATHSNSNAYTNIGIKNMILVGFGGGVDARGAGGTIGSTQGKDGGRITLYNVTFPTNTVTVNGSGGNGYYDNATIGGGNAFTIKIINSTVGSVIINGGDVAGNFGIGYNNGTLYGGSAGTVLNTNSTIGTITANEGLGYIHGCMDNSFGSYNASATYSDGTCTNLAIGSERDNPAGNTISGPIDFNYYNNYGIVSGDANFYRGNNYGTTTGFASFNDSNGQTSNYGYVGGGAYFQDNSSNGGIVNGNTTFDNGSNNGTINGNAIFYNSSSNSNNGTINGNTNFYNASSNSGTINGDTNFDYGLNYGTINGNALLYANNDSSGHYNFGTVTGIISYVYGCTDSSAVNYQSNAYNNDGSCVYYGSASDLPAGITYTGDLTFSNGYKNFGTVNGNAIYYNQDNSYNNGTTTGNAQFSQYYTGVNHDSADNTLYVDGTVYYLGTGIVGGNVLDGNGQVISDIVFSNGQASGYTTKGTVTVNDTSYVNSMIVGDATFNTTYYASTTPSGGVMVFENNDWMGNITGQVLGSDSNPITTYVFYGNTKNLGTINGNAIFYDSSYNAGIVAGNVTYMNVVDGTYTLTSSQVWAGTVTGTIKGRDGLDITNLIFNNSSSNQTTIASTTTVVFNNTASNNGTIQGNASFNGTTFRIGTVNGTATLSGLAQTLRGVSNTVNFFKQVFSRDILYIEQGSTLNVSGLTTILGSDTDNLLTLRSTSPGSYATLNIQGTSDLNYLRIKDIYNTAISQNVATRTVFNDGGNTGFTFPANSTPGSYVSIPSSFTAPSTPPPSRQPVVTVPIQTAPTTNTPTISPTQTSGAQGGTVDRFFTEVLKQLTFKPTTNFDVIKTDGKIGGTTYISNPLQNFAVKTVLDFVKLPSNVFSNMSKLFSPLPNTFKEYPELTNYFTKKGITVTDAKDIIALGRNPIRFKPTDVINVPGVYSLNTPSEITYNKSTGAIIQLVKTQGNKNITLSLVSDTSVTGTFGTETLSFIKKGNMQSVTITTPSKPGMYVVNSSASPISLMIQVVDGVKTIQGEQKKKNGLVNWVMNLFRK